MFSGTKRPIQVLVVGSVLFTFISYWRTAAIVLCDLASTIYYIGGIVEQAIGPAAPWFIAAVMAFSYAVRSVYLESCSLFVRGGVYRVVKAAMGGGMGKLAVSALMFDYILTGPISSVSASQYLVGLILEFLEGYGYIALDKGTRDLIKSWGSVAFAVLIVIYFWRLNVRGVHESSDKALKIMIATSLMAAIMIIWCALTIAMEGARNPLPSWEPNFHPKMNYDVGKVEDPLGFISNTSMGQQLRAGVPDWLTWVGLAGLLIAFGHSILAMSGEETLAQVYREVEAPKMPNFKKAALIVFFFSFIVTPTICFLSILLIPDDKRMPLYSGNLIGGLAMHVMGPLWARLLLNTFVVVIGALILSGAVNTAVIGSNGVLNRVAEDGVIPSWFQKPHPKFGTSYRILGVIATLQIITILLSRGDVITLGEAYAFGVVWSFTLKAMAMLVLRFRDHSPREAKVPLNVPLGNGYELPIGLGLIFLVLLATAVMNLLTKETATIWGISFTCVFMTVFTVSDFVNRQRAAQQGHMDQFNKETPAAVTPAALGITKPYRKLVAIRSPNNLHMLEKALEEVDPETTDLVVMTAKVTKPDETIASTLDLGHYEQELMTAVVNRAEKAGKHVIPVIFPTNNPLFAILTIARELGAQELIMGASNKFTAEVQLDQVAFYWMSLHGEPQPLAVRIIGRNWDTHLDLAGGSPIPTIRERKARSVDDLRAAGIGVRKVLFLHDGKQATSDLFEAVLTMLDESIPLGVALIRNPWQPMEVLPGLDVERAEQLKREVKEHVVEEGAAEELLELVKKEGYDLLIIPRVSDLAPDKISERTEELFRSAPCRVFLAAPPVIPREVEEEGPRRSDDPHNYR